MVDSRRIDAPRSKSPATSSGSRDSRCIRLMKLAASRGSAFCTVRPLATFTRIRPPTCSSVTSRTNLRYSREPVFSGRPLKPATTSCPTRWRTVSPCNQRVAIAFSAASFLAGTPAIAEPLGKPGAIGRALAGFFARAVLWAGAGSTAGTSAAATSAIISGSGRGVTRPLSPIHPLRRGAPLSVLFVVRAVAASASPRPVSVLRGSIRQLPGCPWR